MPDRPNRRPNDDLVEGPSRDPKGEDLSRPGGGGTTALGSGSGSASSGASSAAGDNTPWPQGPDGPLCNDGFTAYLLTPVAGNCDCVSLDDSVGSASGAECPFQCLPDSKVGDKCNPPAAESVPVEGEVDCDGPCPDLLPPAVLLDGDFSGLSACLATALDGVVVPNCSLVGAPELTCTYARAGGGGGACGDAIAACDANHSAQGGYGTRSGQGGYWVFLELTFAGDGFAHRYWKQIDFDGGEVCNQVHTLTNEAPEPSPTYGTPPTEILWVPSELE